MTKKIVKDFLYEKESYEIRGACFDVWKEFGGAFKGSVIDRSLKRELISHRLTVESQKRVPIIYKGKKVGEYIPDFIVNDKILVEIKCNPFLTKEDERQFCLYLKGSSYKLGFLINFGSDKLDSKRRVYDEARQKSDFSVNQRRYRRISASNRGFSLVELILYLAIIGSLVGVVVGMFVSFNRLRVKAESQTELTQNARVTIEKIRQEVVKASAVCDPLVGFPGNSLILIVNGAPTCFAVNFNNALEMSENGTGSSCASYTCNATWNNITSSKVSVTNSDLFTRIENTSAKPTIQIKLTLTYNNKAEYSYTTQTTVSLR